MKTFWTPVLLLSLGCSDQAFGPQGATEPIGGTGGASTTDGDSPLAAPTAGTSGAVNAAGAPSMSALVLAEADLPPAQLEKPYLHQLTVTSEASDVTFELVTGALPAGLTLSPSGELAGTPTEEGEFTLGVQAKSAAANGSKEYRFRVIRRSWLVYRSDDRTPAVNELFAVNVAAGEPYQPVVLNHELAQGEQVASWSAEWSPDGSFMSYTTENSAANQLYLVDMRGLNPQPPISVGKVLAGVIFSSPPDVTWAPDSSALIVGNSDNYHLIELTNGIPGSATAINYATGTTWSPDSLRIAYTMGTARTDSTIHLKRREPGIAIRQVTAEESVSHGHFTPDGQKLWFNGESGDLYFAYTAGDSPRAIRMNLPRVNLLGANPGWPTSDFIYFVAPGVVTGQHEIYRARFDSSPKPEALVSGIDTGETGMDYRDINPVVLGKDSLLSYRIGTRGSSSVRQHIRALATGEHRSWEATPDSYIARSQDDTLALVSELYQDGEELNRCAISASGIDSCYSLNTTVPGFRITNKAFSPNTQGAVFLGGVSDETRKAYYADFRGDVRPAVPLHEQGEAYGMPYPPFNPASTHVALLLKDGNAQSVAVVDVTRQVPGEPVRVSGEGIVSTVSWQPR